jgi:hypothetical protein
MKLKLLKALASFTGKSLVISYIVMNAKHF